MCADKSIQSILYPKLPTTFVSEEMALLKDLTLQAGQQYERPSVNVEYAD